MNAVEPALAQFSAPLYVAWELTHKCNARCVHCYSASGPDSTCDTELSLSVALDLIDQLADAGVLVLAFSGGEPLMHRHWKRLVSHAVGRGLNVNIGSNGSTVTAKHADVLAELGVKSVTISVDSHDAAVHDRFRQLAGLHSKAILAIKRLVERGVRVVVGFTPTKLNWAHGTEVIELAYRLGANAANLSEYVPAGRGSLDLALSPDELRAVLAEWIDARRRYQGRMEIIWHDCRVGMLVPDDEKRNYVGCGAGRLVARILPDGTITPCVFLPTPIGRIRDSSFKALWSGAPLLRQFRERVGHVSGNCGSCAHLKTCGGCRAAAYAYSRGDPLAGDPHCWVIPFGPQRMSALRDGEGLPV